MHQLEFSPEGEEFLENQPKARFQGVRWDRVVTSDSSAFVIFVRSVVQNFFATPRSPPRLAISLPDRRAFFQDFEPVFNDDQFIGGGARL